MYTQHEPKVKKPQKTEEELRKEFEQWKKSMFTEYDQSRHDQFLKNRFYKMHTDFNASEHFNHPNAESGPSSAPSSPYKRSAFTFHVSESSRFEHYREKAK
jgi:hypothetical protein